MMLFSWIVFEASENICFEVKKPDKMYSTIQFTEKYQDTCIQAIMKDKKFISE